MADNRTAPATTVGHVTPANGPGVIKVRELTTEERHAAAEEGRALRLEVERRTAGMGRPVDPQAAFAQLRRDLLDEMARVRARLLAEVERMREQIAAIEQDMARMATVLSARMILLEETAAYRETAAKRDCTAGDGIE